MKKFVKILIVFVCFTLNSSVYLNSIATADRLSTDEYSYYDNQNLMRIVKESDGTIKVYKNGILDHSAKSDLNSDMLKVTYYNSGNDLATVNRLPQTTVYKLSILVANLPESLEETRIDSIQPYATDPQFPYSSGYSFKESYYDSGVTNLTVEGFTKPDGIQYTSAKKVSFFRNMTIGAAVSVFLTVLSGGTVTVAVVTSAIVGAAAGALIDGIFTKDVDVNVNYEIRWSKWLGWIRAKNFEYYTLQGIYYLRTVNQSANIVDTRLADNMPPDGWKFSFNDFLRQTITQYTNR